jgi:competence protein ComEC
MNQRDCRGATDTKSNFRMSRSKGRILAENGANELRADVLKIGHHGSKNSTMPDFLAAVQPRIRIISSGEGNPYGHPSPELPERLEKAGVRIYRTDSDRQCTFWRMERG